MARDFATQFLNRKRKEQASMPQMQMDISIAPSPYERYGVSQMGDYPLQSGKYTGDGPNGVSEPHLPTERRIAMNGRPYVVDESEVLVNDAETVRAYGGPERLDIFIQQNRPDGKQRDNEPVRMMQGGVPSNMRYNRGGIPGQGMGMPVKAMQGYGTPGVPDGTGPMAGTQYCKGGVPSRYFQGGIPGKTEQMYPAGTVVNPRGVPSMAPYGQFEQPYESQLQILREVQRGQVPRMVDSGMTSGTTSGTLDITNPASLQTGDLTSSNTIVGNATPEKPFGEDSAIQPWGTPGGKNRTVWNPQTPSMEPQVNLDTSSHVAPSTRVADAVATPVTPQVNLDTSSHVAPSTRVADAVATPVTPQVNLDTSGHVAPSTTVAPEAKATGVEAVVGGPKYNSIGQQTGVWTQEEIDRTRGVQPTAPAPTPTAPAPTPTGQPALSQSQVDQMVLDQYLSRMGGMQESERAAEAQRLMQQGVSTEAARGIGAVSDVSRRSAMGEAAARYGVDAAQRAEDRSVTNRAFEESKRRWDEQYGVTQANQIAEDAGTMTKETWLAKYGEGSAWAKEGNVPMSGDDFERAREIADRGYLLQERQVGLSEATLDENIRQFNVGVDQTTAANLLKAGDFEGYAAFYQEKFGVRPDMSNMISEWNTQQAMNEVALENSKLAVESAQFTLSEMQRNTAGKNLFTSIDKALKANPDVVRSGDWKKNSEIMSDLEQYWNTSGMANKYGYFSTDNKEAMTWAENQVQAMAINEIDNAFTEIKSSEMYRGLSDEEKTDYENNVFPAMFKLMLTSGYDISMDDEGNISVEPMSDKKIVEPEEQVVAAFGGKDYKFEGGYLNVDGKEIRDTKQLVDVLSGGAVDGSENNAIYKQLLNDAPEIGSIPTDNKNRFTADLQVGKIVNVGGRLMQVGEVWRRKGRPSEGYTVYHIDGTTEHSAGRAGREYEQFELIDLSTGGTTTIEGNSASAGQMYGFIGNLKNKELGI